MSTSITHDDFDHYDPDAIEAVAEPDATVAVYEFATDTFHIPDDEIVFQTFAGKVSPRE